jgi:hypothetical protein
MIHFRSSHRIRERAGHAPGYLALDIRLPTLIEYRKRGIGPDFAVVGRTILYSRAHFQTCLENGGTRAFTGNEPAPEQAPEQPMGRRGARDAPSVNGPTGHRAGPHHQPRGDRDDGYQPS